MSKELIGIVGVGRMGLAIVKHLKSHDYPSIVCDLSEERCAEAAEAGAAVVGTPAEIAKVSKFIIIAVGFDDEATAVIAGKDGLLEMAAPGSVVVVSSTCTPDHVRGLEAQVKARSCVLVDAPICRGARAADAGTMLALVGATDEDFARAKPVLSTFCSDISLLGPVGSGQFGKALNNFLLWVNGVALIEAGRLSEANGMDLVKLREALLMSSGASDALKNWENVSFIWALKDMQIVMKMADLAGLSLPIAGSIKELVKDGLRIKQSNPPDWTGRNRI
jgi:3-hydroxyisobutyrate dehydrogenase